MLSAFCALAGCHWGTTVTDIASASMKFMVRHKNSSVTTSVISLKRQAWRRLWENLTREYDLAWGAGKSLPKGMMFQALKIK